MAVPASVFGRAWLIMSLAELGRFAEAAKYEAEAIQLAEPTQHAHTIGWAHFAASMLHFSRATGRRRAHWSNIGSTYVGALDVAVLLPWAVASSAWALAQIGEASEALSRVREAEELLERQAATGIVGHRSWAYYAVGRACLLLGRLDEARRLGYRSVESSQRQPGFAAHALQLLGDISNPSGPVRCRKRRSSLPAGAGTRPAHGMRPLVAHCHLGLGKLYRRTGKPEQARENLAAATTMYREMDMDFWLEQGWRRNWTLRPRFALPSRILSAHRLCGRIPTLAEGQTCRTERSQLEALRSVFVSPSPTGTSGQDVFPTRRRFSLRGALR